MMSMPSSSSAMPATAKRRLDRGGVDMGHPTYSTVTDFARFRGWSTSVPRAIATS